MSWLPLRKKCVWIGNEDSFVVTASSPQDNSSSLAMMGFKKRLCINGKGMVPKEHSFIQSYFDTFAPSPYKTKVDRLATIYKKNLSILNKKVKDVLQMSPRKKLSTTVNETFKNLDFFSVSAIESFSGGSRSCVAKKSPITLKLTYVPLSSTVKTPKANTTTTQSVTKSVKLPKKVTRRSVDYWVNYRCISEGINIFGKKNSERPVGSKQNIGKNPRYPATESKRKRCLTLQSRGMKQSVASTFLAHQNSLCPSSTPKQLPKLDVLKKFHAALEAKHSTQSPSAQKKKLGFDKPRLSHDLQSSERVSINTKYVKLQGKKVYDIERRGEVATEKEKEMAANDDPYFRPITQGSIIVTTRQGKRIIK